MMLLAFDLDGTLGDSRPDMLASVHRCRASLGLPPRTDGDILPFLGEDIDTLVQRCFDDHDGGRGAVRDRYLRDYLDHIADQTRLYDGIATVLPEVGPWRVVVTNKPEGHGRALLDSLGVGRLFQTVVGTDSTPEARPSANPLQDAVERLGWEGEVVMIGDSVDDIAMAKEFGAFSVWCAWGYLKAPLHGADAVARHPRDLPALVAELAAGRFPNDAL